MSARRKTSAPDRGSSGRASSATSSRSSGRLADSGPRRGKTAGFAFGPINYLLFAAAAAAIVGGYVLLSRGSVTAAPLLLVLGYIGLIPAALLAGLSGSRRRTKSDD